MGVGVGVVAVAGAAVGEVVAAVDVGVGGVGREWGAGVAGVAGVAAAMATTPAGVCSVELMVCGCAWASECVCARCVYGTSY